MGCLETAKLCNITFARLQACARACQPVTASMFLNNRVHSSISGAQPQQGVTSRHAYSIPMQPRRLAQKRVKNWCRHECDYL